MKNFLSRVVLSSSVLLAGLSSTLHAQSTVPTTIVPLVSTPIATVPPATATAVPKNVVSDKAEQPGTLSEVVVTANRIEADPQNISSSETILTTQDLERKQAGTVKDALQAIPGLDITQSGNPGSNTGVYIRGNNTENTLVLLDGVPLNDPIGTPFDYEYLDSLSLDGVKQIEVIRGPQSTLWGSNAIGGVINIVPQSGPAPLGGSVLMEGGSYGTSREVVAAQGGDNGGYFNFSASHYNTAGFPALDPKGLNAADSAAETVATAGTLNNGDDNNSAFLRLGSNLTSNLEEKVFVRYGQSNTSVDAFNNNYVLADDPAYFVLQKQFLVDSHTDWKLFDGVWGQQLSLSFADDNRLYNAVSNPYNSYYSNSAYDGQTAQAIWQNNVRLAKEETIILGLQGQKEWAYSSANTGDSINGANTPSSIPVTSVQSASAFVQSQTSLEDNLFLNLAGRWEKNNQFGEHTTYQAGLAYWVPGLDTKLKANYGTGFLAPSLYQLFDPTYGFTGLQPETSIGFDFGFEQSIGGKKGLTFGASYFDNDIINLISYDPTTYVSANVGKAWTYGVESFVDLKAISNLDVKGSYTYTYAQDLSKYTPLVRRPQNKASGDADYQWGDATFGTTVSYTGSDNDVDFNGNTVTLPSCFLVNLRAAYQINPQVKLFARVDNLFNQWYEQLYGYRTEGLSVYGGTKVSF